MSNSVHPKDTYIAIASRQFAKSGYHGTTLAALAKDAGVSKQALLHFFSSKEKLYAAVLTALAKRLLIDFDAAKDADPHAQLQGYFLTFHDAAMARPQDVQLVVRALLDSEPDARIWPLKPYLDAIIKTARRTRGGMAATDGEMLAWMAQLIGIIQYNAIAAPAITGMYGRAPVDEAQAATRLALSRLISEFLKG